MRPGSGSGHLAAWVPTGLLDLDPGSSLPISNAEGLTAVQLRWDRGQLLAPIPLDPPNVSPEALVLPRLVDAHVHLDKAFTWSSHPNPSGTYLGALNANLKEHATRTEEAVYLRGEQSLQRAFECGVRAMRTHIDSGGPGARPSWDALLALQQDWRQRIHLQCVALVPLEFWSSSEAEDLAVQVAECGGCLGGVLAPPRATAATADQLEVLLRLADRLGCGIDLHIDEGEQHPAAGMRQLLRALGHCPVDVPVTCSHASSLALLPPRRLDRLAEAMAEAALQVIALPLTNAWLLARSEHATPLQRPQAPIRQLQRRGVTVAVAGDNVADPWFPGGDFDPLALLAATLPLTQLLPWQRLGLAPFTTAPASLLQLEWDGRIGAGAPADLIRIDGDSWSDLLRPSPRREVLVNGHWIAAQGARP